MGTALKQNKIIMCQYANVPMCQWAALSCYQYANMLMGQWAALSCCIAIGILAHWPISTLFNNYLS